MGPEGYPRQGEVPTQGQREHRRRILAWFADTPEAPFSIHRIAGQGTVYGPAVGSWFGPSVMAQVIG